MTTPDTAAAPIGIDGPVVTLLAHTTITQAAIDRLPRLATPFGPTGPDHLHEYAGRACYDSWTRPNPTTADNADYLANVLAQGHESVVAHAAATFHLTGVSRSLTHELIRHRFLAVSERSLRFVDAENFRPVYPPAADEGEKLRIDNGFAAALIDYEGAVDRYREQGLPRKQAREAARAHLPLCTETSIVVSSNMRGWRDFLRQRTAVGADREIKAVAHLLLAQLLVLAPATFADISKAVQAQ